jgi:tripartite-type tricarboxylate transporter receptor subunit TctC
MTLKISRRAVMGAAALAPFAAQAQSDWPNRPVRIVVPFPPGQAADIFTRLVADELSKRWPQRVVVENRAGGASVPGVESVARAPADGYTLLTGTSGPLGVNPSVMPRLPYDVEKDFAFITNVVMVPLLVIAHPSVSERTIQELAASAKARPGQIDMASAVAAELLMLRAGIRFNIVHYRGSGPAIADVIAGNVKLMTDSVASALPHIQSGRVRPIALCSARRVPQLPDVPTIAESLVPGYEASGWSGLVAPTGTPPEIINRINTDVVAILRDPAIIKRIEDMGAVADPLTPDQFGTFVRAEVAKWREVARAGNVKLEG